MNCDRIYPLTDTELAYIERYGTRGIYTILADIPSSDYEKEKYTFVKTISQTSGRCYYEAWELHKDAEGKMYLRHTACDSSD
jgi:hypothetical protein